jgi:predicted kinase
MKTFLEKLHEDTKTHHPVVMAFGRMNPPTIGHEKLVNKVKQIAADHNAPHHVILSHSQNAKKDPLDVATKVKHAKRLFPNTNIENSSKEEPTFLQHAARLHKMGHDHLIMVAGSDRVDEFKKKLEQYNGEGEGKLYNFKKIEVKSAGQRDPDAEGVEGMSASKMREHAKNNDFNSFKQGIPHHVPEKHSKELFRDLRKGMGINEDVQHGLYKAVFITGGPGSGKDTVIRDAIAEGRAVEINTIQAFEFLADKHKLSESTKDERRNAIKQHKPLIINGSANDIDRIKYVKEELEELGYETMMIFVDTTNETSSSRNQKLTRMMVEDVRQDKWIKSQENAKVYNEAFDLFIRFDNTIDFDKADVFDIARIEEEISQLLMTTKLFYGQKAKVVVENFNNEFAKLFEIGPHSTNQKDTLKNLIKSRRDKMRQDSEIHKKSIDKLKQSLRGEETNVEEDSIPTKTKAKDTCGHGKLIADNNCPTCQLGRIAGKKDEIKYGDVPGNPGSYTFRTYEETESIKEDGPTLTKIPEPKEPNFQKDNEKVKKKAASVPNEPTKRIKVTGLGPEFATRGSGTVYPMSGLGNTTYGEETKPKSFKSFREAIDSPASDMGVSGGYHGATNSEPMQSYKDKDRNIGIEIKKKKNNKGAK